MSEKIAWPPRATVCWEYSKISIWASWCTSLVGHPDRERREEEVDRVPADGAGEVALQRGRELDHVREQDLGVLGRLRDRERVGQGQAELLHVLERLARAVRPVDEPEVVQVDVAARVRVGHVLREDQRERELLLSVHSAMVMFVASGLCGTLAFSRFLNSIIRSTS